MADNVPATPTQPAEQKYCPNCRGGNAPQAQICQWCGYSFATGAMPGQSASYTPPGPPQQNVNVAPPQRRSPILLIVLGLVGVCLILGIIGALAGGGRNTASNTTIQARPTNTAAAEAPAVTSPTDTPVVAPEVAPTDTPATAPEVAPTDTPVPPPAAEMPGVGDTAETDNLRITLNEVRHEATGLIAPDDGHEYVIVNVTFENKSNEEQNVSTLLQMSLRDDTGQRYTIAFGSNAESTPDGSIAPGDKLRGDVPFEVPTTATGLVFVFDPILGGDAVRFKLDR